LKYGYNKFSLDILEYCDKFNLIEREQYYLDNLKPEYNISKIAGSRIGCKHSEKTKKLISNASKIHRHSEESKEKMRVAAKIRTGEKTSFFGKIHTIKSRNLIALKKFLPIKVTNVETNNVKIFKNNSEAAKHLKVGESTLRRYKKKGKILLKKYLIINA
jgi:group I intron endonuclease